MRLVPEIKPALFVGLVARTKNGVPATRISMQNTSTHYGTGPGSKSLRLVPTLRERGKLEQLLFRFSIVIPSNTERRKLVKNTSREDDDFPAASVTDFSN